MLNVGNNIRCGFCGWGTYYSQNKTVFLFGWTRNPSLGFRRFRFSDCVCRRVRQVRPALALGPLLSHAPASRERWAGLIVSMDGLRGERRPGSHFRSSSAPSRLRAGEEDEGPVELPKGKLVANRFLILEKLGEGGCGSVYKASGGSGRSFRLCGRAGVDHEHGMWQGLS